tara:strand:- start:1312 stop:2178 length:867 start_codon:yes stop_codon:yes gene_type:complete
MKKIVVLGAKGFLGKNLCHFFHNQEKYQVSPLSRIDVDFTDIEALTKKIKDISPNYIIHSAVSLDNFENNIRMFYALEKVAGLVEKIILIGSGAEYISARYKPLMKENYFSNGPVYPVDIYTLSKYTISKLLSISNAKNIFNLRVFGIYGPYEDFQRRLISNNLVRNLNNLPLQYNRNVAFDYLYIDDFLTALDRFISLEKPIHNTYNLCVGKAYKFKKIMETIAEVVGIDLSDIILNDPTPSNYEYSGDPTLIENEIGKIEQTKLVDAITSLYSWYKNQDLNSLKLN